MGDFKCPLPMQTIGLNLRAILTADEWDDLRYRVFARADWECEVCGFDGEWALQCHEHWTLNRSAKRQTFKRLVSVCRHCHEWIHGDPKILGTGWSVDMTTFGSGLFYSAEVVAEFRERTRYHSASYKAVLSRLLRVPAKKRNDRALRGVLRRAA